jgi:uncharacterized protein (TIGR02594 family)
MTQELPWMLVAKSLIGTKENPAKNSSNPSIIKWAALAEIPGYTNDDIPWCGLFVAHCFVECGVDYVDKPLWARNWAKFGDKLDDPAYGAVMTFTRGSGGHVGFHTGETANHYLILGGNQSNAVNISKIEKSRLLSINWPTRFIGRLDDDTGTDLDGNYPLSEDER